MWNRFDNFMKVATVFAVATFLNIIITEVKLIPEVIAFLFSGILLGPHGAGYLDANLVDQLMFLRKIALGIIFFKAGTEFRYNLIREANKKAFLISISEILFTFLSVFLPFFFLLRFDFRTAFILGIIAIPTAPAVSFFVMREAASEGPITSKLKIMIPINNFIALMLFEMFFRTSGVIRLNIVFEEILLAAVFGFFLSYLELKEKSDNSKLLLVFTFILLAIGVSQLLNFSFMLFCLLMGFFHTNLSLRENETRELLSRVDLLFILFLFILEGAEFDLHSFFTMGMFGMVYLFGRLFGKGFGTYVSTGIAKFPKEWRKALFFGILSHSETVLAMIAAISITEPMLGGKLRGIVFGAIIVFELVGSILLRYSLLRNGEVSVADVFRHRKMIFDISDLINVLKQFGKLKNFIGTQGREKKGLHEMLIRESVAINNGATYDKVLKFVEHSNYDCFPVLDNDGLYIGYIDFYELEKVFFEEELCFLVTAKDLITSEDFIDIDKDKRDIIRNKFQKAGCGYLPAVSVKEEKTHFVGMLPRFEFLKEKILK